MTLAELLAERDKGTKRFPAWSLADLLARRDEPLNAKFNPSGVGPGMSYGTLASILTDFAPGIGDAKSAADAVKEAGSGNYGMAALDALGALPMVAGMGAIKAYHGSPHKFDAFDMSKIGTGEGAQAYGYGSYLSESPLVAKEYQKNLSSLYGVPTTVSGAGNKVPIPAWLGEKIKSDGIDSAIKEWAERAAEQRAKATESKQPWINEANASRLENDLELMKQIKASGEVDVEDPGFLYEASLEWPDPAREASDPLGPQHFLDWDKPLMEQGDYVRGALKEIGDTPEDIKGAISLWENQLSLGGRRAESAQKELDRLNRKLLQSEIKTGSDINNRLISEAIGKSGNPRESASHVLNNIGIPGIRYLDQGSRGAGDGTYNYVVFDDKIPRIVSRNGVSLFDLLGR